MKNPIAETIVVPQGASPSFTRYVFPRANVTAKSGDGAPRPSWSEVVDQAEIETRERRAWERGLEEGEQRARAEFAEALRQERAVLQRIVAEAERDRRTYFQQAEVEVVNLALAIARKILEREVRLDTLMLRGAVRVALEKVAAATEVRLRVPAASADAWRRHLESEPDLGARPEVQPDPTLEPGQCVLETSLGTTDLGWASQLKELEQSFLDLMALKPGAR